MDAPHLPRAGGAGVTESAMPRLPLPPAAIALRVLSPATLSLAVLPLAILALAALLPPAVSAAGGSAPTASEIANDAAARGLAFDGATRAPLGGLSEDGRCATGGRALVIPLAAAVADGGPFVRDTAYVCPDLGTYWLARETLRPVTRDRFWIGPVPLYGLAGAQGLSRRILGDLERRGVDWFRAGTATPSPGPRGETRPDLEDGAVVVALATQPAGGADFFTDLAWLDPQSRLYWAHREGGFPGADLWVGPFPAPLVTDEAPTEVRPPAVRAREKTIRRRLTILRPVTGDESIRVRRRDYRRSDIDLGPGVEVRRILRADRERIRVRVRIAPDATPGERAVAVRGLATPGLLRIE